MSEAREFGKPEGLGKRLAMWSNTLARNKSYPWVGTGLIDDIKCAARGLGVDPDDLYPAEIERKPEPAPVEYDL